MVHASELKHIIRLFAAAIVLIAMTGADLAGAQGGPAYEGRYVGATVLLQGRVVDTDGNAVPGAVVEIWQTDINGSYNHPADTDPGQLVDGFQYFGTATTDADGYYAFLTVKAAPYEVRPAHVHFKVKIDGQEVLTSQFYYEEDRDDVLGDGTFGGAGDSLFLQTEDDVEADLADDGMRIATGNIVLDMNGSASDALPPTAAQAEGPYYPVVDFSGYDNNLTSTAPDDEIVLPLLGRERALTGTFDVGVDLTIAALRGREITGSDIVLEERLADGPSYAQYIASYISEGNKIYGLLTVPFGDVPPGGFKAIVFNHGYIPPDAYRTTERYVPYVGTLASHGFVVFKIDMRGHGNSEGEATGAYYSPAYTIDAIAALKSLQRMDMVDPQGIGMWGHSMSGNVVLRAMLVEPDIKAGVIWAGAVFSYEDFVRYRISDPSRPPAAPDGEESPSRRRSRLIREAYGEPDLSHPYWQAVSLTENIEYLQDPLQIHHAVNDTVVNVGYSIELSAVLDANNKLYEFYQYAGGGHDIDSPYFEEAILRTVAFFQKHL